MWQGSTIHVEITINEPKYVVKAFNLDVNRLIRLIKYANEDVSNLTSSENASESGTPGPE